MRAALRELAGSLPPFSAQARRPSAAESRYLRFYGLDFPREFPQLRHDFGAVQSGDFRLAVHRWRWGERRKNLLLVHGYLDHAGLYGRLIRFGLERGCNVVAFDLPGHGLSGGDSVAIDDFAHYRRAIADVLARCDEPEADWSVIAQSTGGAALMDFLQTRRDAFRRVVLLAPLIRPAGWWWARIAHRLLNRIVQRVPRGFAENSHDADFLQFLRRDPLQSRTLSVQWVGALGRWLRRFQAGEPCPQPLLVIQGDEDDTVDWKYNMRELKRLFPAARIEILAGARHHLANESAGLRSEYLGLIERYLEEATAPR